MPAPSTASLARNDSATWRTKSDTVEPGEVLAGSPLALPLFFLAWAGIGAVVGLGMARRGHDLKVMVALGLGLGPLMVLVATKEARRLRRAEALVIAPGRDHGGNLDVVVVLQGDARQVQSVQPTLAAVRPDLGVLTLARAVPYEWLEPAPGPLGDETESERFDSDVDSEVIANGRSVLLAARDLVWSAAPALVIFPGLPADAATQFARPHHAMLVLTATDDDAPASNGG